MKERSYHIFKEEMEEKKRFPEHISFMDSMLWYCKKHFLVDKCTEEIKDGSDFYDLIKVFDTNREFISFFLYLYFNWLKEKKENDANT